MVFCNSSEWLTNVNPTERARVGSQGGAYLGFSASFYENANQKQLKPTQFLHGRNLLAVYTKMKGNLGDVYTRVRAAKPLSVDEQITTVLLAIFLLNSQNLCTKFYIPTSILKEEKRHNLQ